MHGLSSSSVLGLRISLTSSRRLKYNKKLPGNKVRNNLAVGHVEKFGYCVRESCQVSLMKALCVSLFGFVLFLSCFSLFLLGERKLLSPAVCLTPPQPVQSESDRILQHPSPLIPLFPLQIKMCETCQNAEHNKNVPRKARPVRVESPWEVLGLDIHGE